MVNTRATPAPDAGPSGQHDTASNDPRARLEVLLGGQGAPRHGWIRRGRYSGGGRRDPSASLPQAASPPERRERGFSAFKRSACARMASNLARGSFEAASCWPEGPASGAGVARVLTIVELELEGWEGKQKRRRLNRGDGKTVFS
ncbi:hypothetical protein E4U19_005719 [Claviceps sp. Clav32 group G5]|nr:hypothetical protein E4U40_005850 [Claviceps sp. LM458 group G5]KAG6021385.1 hypothetical protein E4U19_005719 [Claviceps sp. Clav32 group G5]